jgi:hypothetical protein
MTRQVFSKNLKLKASQKLKAMQLSKRPKRAWPMALLQAALLSPRQALVQWRQALRRGPRPEECAVHGPGNKFTGLLRLNSVPMLARRQFGPHNLNQMNLTSYAISSRY